MNAASSISRPTLLTPETSARVAAFANPSPPDPFFFFCALYVLLYTSRLTELPFLSPVRPMLTSSVVLLVLAIVTMRIASAFDTTHVRLTALFLVWMSVSTVFSRWRGGSFTIFVDATKIVIAVIIIVSFLQTVEQATRMISVAGLGFGLTAAIGLFTGGVEAGRMTAVGGNSTLNDSNYFAMYMVLGLPMLVFRMKRVSVLGKLLCVALMLISLRSIVATGSRSGMLSLVAMVAFLFWKATSRQRLIILVVTLAGVLAIASLAPEAILRRITTLTTAQQAAEDLGEAAAAASAESRLYILKRSFAVTFANPLFGAGPGTFMEEEEEMARAEGLTPVFHVTHNMYMQVASEMGIPAFILFVSLVVMQHKGLNQVRRWAKTLPQFQGTGVEQAVTYLHASLIVLTVEGFFLSIAFSSAFWTFVPLCAGLYATSRKLAMQPIPHQAAAPAPAASRFRFSLKNPLAR